MFAKFEKMRLLSESELRNILFKEIDENKRYLEHINSQSHSKRLFKNESLSNSNLNEDYSVPKFRDQGTDMSFLNIGVPIKSNASNKISSNNSMMFKNQIKITPKESSITLKNNEIIKSFKRTPVKISNKYNKHK